MVPPIVTIELLPSYHKSYQIPHSPTFALPDSMTLWIFYQNKYRDRNNQRICEIGSGKYPSCWMILWLLAVSLALYFNIGIIFVCLWKQVTEGGYIMDTKYGMAHCKNIYCNTGWLIINTIKNQSQHVQFFYLSRHIN